MGLRKNILVGLLVNYFMLFYFISVGPVKVVLKLLQYIVFNLFIQNVERFLKYVWPFFNIMYEKINNYDRSFRHIGTSKVICSPNHGTGFCVIETLVIH